MNKAPKGPFVVMFNDHQRLLMLRMFTVALNDPGLKASLLKQPDPEGLQDNQFEAAHTLYEMTAALPSDNEVSDDKSWGANGRVVHCFAL